MSLPLPVRGRIAPTPSGWLHVGNAYNFLLTWLTVRKQDGRLRLRIDDLDGTRVRVQYLEDIFRTLDWLKLDWDEGPTSVTMHQQTYAQHHRMDLYREALSQLKEEGHLFACTCSRREIQAQSVDGQYPGSCRSRQLPYEGTPPNAWRIRTPSHSSIQWEDRWQGTQTVNLHVKMRDFILRRKDGLPAYQIASVVDDILYKINAIVRGIDLMESTAAQLWLAYQKGYSAFSEIAWYHHPLLRNPQGEKLSKSAGAQAIHHQYTHSPTPVAFYTDFSLAMGWTEVAHSAKEALQLFDLRQKPLS